jgi:hypothetical protein
MKTIILTFVFIVGVCLTSCKKDYTCTCTSDCSGSSITSTASYHSTKKKAKESCDQAAATPGCTTTCTIN